MGVGDLVEGDEQRRAPGGEGALEQVAGGDVLVGGDLDGHALVDGAPGQGLQVELGGLQHGGAQQRGAADDGAQAVVGGGGGDHEDAAHGHASAGDLGDSVAPADDETKASVCA